jgi:peptidoglycan L-alanyl-D-glutamate endopeptidase CwlK
MRDITKTHPTLQKRVKKWQAACKKAHIIVAIGECVRTAAEQDALYAKGRTAPGKKCTNARGWNFSSMHQWGVAVDFYLKMDIDKDGKTSDDAFNDSTGMFEKAGAIAKKCRLEWGGGWTSIKDRPHLQLPEWGSTPYLLRQKYGTPERFMKTWKHRR